MRKETIEDINEKLMKLGYLCPNYELHDYILLEWEGRIRNMKCKKCGDIAPAMCIISSIYRSNPK